MSERLSAQAMASPASTSTIHSPAFPAFPALAVGFKRCFLAIQTARRRNRRRVKPIQFHGATSGLGSRVSCRDRRPMTTYLIVTAYALLTFFVVVPAGQILQRYDETKSAAMFAIVVIAWPIISCCRRCRVHGLAEG
jgi:hypothetical protein